MPKVRVINIPTTTTILALGFLIGNFALMPALQTFAAKDIPEWLQPAVLDVVRLFKDGMLLIIGYYFAKASGIINEKLVDKVQPATGEARDSMDEQRNNQGNSQPGSAYYETDRDLAGSGSEGILPSDAVPGVGREGQPSLP